MNNTSINGSKNDIDIVFPGCDEYDIITGHEVNLMIEPNQKVNKLLKTPQKIDSLVTRIPLTHKYEEEWTLLYKRSQIDIDELKTKALNGELRSSHFRSLCWRCLLGILHSDPRQWVFQLTTYRKHYRDVRQELETNPWNIKVENPTDNPLSQESESIWQKYFSDQDLRAVIFQDVTRTFPGIDFFRNEKIQELMVQILFCYARQNPSLCYRQGMHEILAPLVFILHCDHEAFLQAKENGDLAEAAMEILDPDCLEEDAYTIFKHVMSHIESSYRISNLVPTSSGYFPNSTSETAPKACENEVVNRLEHIREALLVPLDTQLAAHLQDLDIPLQLFGIRWLRLLFGREFPLQDLLALWDAIFAKGFDLVDYVVVSMLITIRQYLLDSDYTSCLTCLMRYPNGIDISFVIGLALHLKDPGSYPSVPQPPALPLPRPAPPAGSPHTPSRPRPKQPESLEVNLARVKRLKNVPGPPRPAQWIRGRAHPLVLGRNGDGDSNIIDGYTVDDPNVLSAELEHAQAVMSLVRLKLSQYHATLSVALPQPLPGEAQQAIEGIHELCYLLKSHQTVPATEVERADEAGEVKPLENAKTEKPPEGAQKAADVGLAGLAQGKSHTLPKLAKKRVSGELKTFKESYGGPIKGAPMEDPLRQDREMTRQDEDLYRFLRDINRPALQRVQSVTRSNK